MYVLIFVYLFVCAFVYVSSDKQTESEITPSLQNGIHCESEGGRGGEGEKEGEKDGMKEVPANRDGGGTGSEKESQNKVQEGERKKNGGKERRPKGGRPRDKEVKSDATVSNHHKLLMSWERDFPLGLQGTRAPVLFALDTIPKKLETTKG